MIRGGQKYDSPGMGRVYCEAWKAAYAGIVPQEFLDGLTPESSAPPAEKISAENCLVYEDGGIVAGLVTFGPTRDGGDAGEIRTLYVLPGFWRNGAGSELFATALQKMKDAGYRRVCVWTLTENGRARRFYEKMGMINADERQIEIAGKMLSETRYDMDI